MIINTSLVRHKTIPFADTKSLKPFVPVSDFFTYNTSPGTRTSCGIGGVELWNIDMNVDDYG